MSLLEKWQPIIDRYDIISFDIFDTLLLRPYTKPTDLFLHLEKAYQKSFFYLSRIEAEKEARKHHKDREDITLDMIYDEIDEEYKTMKQRELDWERMVLRPNPELKQVYDYVKALGKKIIITSDMYLPTDFLASILRQNGFDEWNKLYVSGDICKTKYKGSLYQQILQDYTLPPSKLLHIGDNKHSDFLLPKKLKIKAICYKPPYTRLTQKYPFFKKYKKSSSLGLSIIQALYAKQEYEEDKSTHSYWFNLGFKYAGPLAYAYAHFIEKEAKINNLDTLFFIARDGYLLQKVFSTFNTSINTKYVYAPRILNNLIRLDYAKKDVSSVRAIITHYAPKDPKIALLYEQLKPHTPKQAHQFIQEHIELFLPLAREELNHYRAYMQKNMENAKHIGLVDTITGAFSSQKLVEMGLENNVLGIYWGVVDQTFTPMFEYTVFAGETQGQSADYPNIFTHNWNFIEFLLTSPEHPIINLNTNGTPIYAKEQHPMEIKRSALYKEIVSGAIAFAEMMVKTFNGADIHLTARDVVNLVNTFITHPTAQDMKKMAEVMCSEDAGHQVFVPLFATKIKAIDFIKHPKNSLICLKKCIWKTPLQTAILCLLKPITIRSRGLKKLSLVLFPSLKKKYFAMSLGWNENINYEFVIGNVKGKL
ncbi:MAG: hypothetical protein NC218_10880 [Acetobacter sp.]|nr:hypothetical protein [Acetobacter sp.]